MADDLKNRGPADRNRISLSEDWEVSYWTKELGITAEELKNMVTKYGPMASAVRAALPKHN